MKILLTLAIALAIAAPALADPAPKPKVWSSRLAEAFRGAHRYRARRNQVARDRAFARCLRDEDYKVERCVGRRVRGGRRK